MATAKSQGNPPEPCGVKIFSVTYGTVAVCSLARSHDGAHVGVEDADLDSVQRIAADPHRMALQARKAGFWT
jgi:hypothetical protein